MEEAWEFVFMKNAKKPEYIYVLTNPAMPDIVKIGRTTLTIEKRMRQLNKTGVPLPFECFFAAQVKDGHKTERAIHLAFDDLRINKKREFFRISPDKPRAIIKLSMINEVTPAGDVVEDEVEQAALDDARSRKSNFEFSHVNLLPGFELTSVFDPDVKATVCGKRSIKFRGKSTSLSAAALQVARENGRTWKSIRGTAYWMFKGETLDDLRSSEETYESDEL